MTNGCRFCISSLILFAVAAPRACALFNLNEGRDQIFVTGTYSIGYDSNVFTRSSGGHSFTQNATLSSDYLRQAGVLAVEANAMVSSGRFESLHGQDYTDPSVSLTVRKRRGRLTGTLSASVKRQSDPDPDVGERTRFWNYSSELSLRYPVNDRYYFTNDLTYTGRFYTGQNAFSDLNAYSDSILVNYIYTSKLDLNGGYSIRISDTSKDTRAYDHSFIVGASGGILPKLTGTVRFGVERRDLESNVGHREHFDAFTSGTSLKWLYSRKLSFTGDLNEDFGMSATDISTNRTSASLHANASISSRYFTSGGVTYSINDFLGRAGGGREDDLFQIDASLGAALTTHVRMNLSYSYTDNNSNVAVASFIRHNVTFSIIATF